MTVHRVAAAISSTVVLITVIVGLYLSGSPSDQRLLRLDERRVRDLSMISNAVQIYWQEQGELPADLQTLVDGRRLNELPVDPVSADAYEYIGGDEAFRLCAVFDSPSTTTGQLQFWSHAAGRECFDFDTAMPAALAPMPMLRRAPAIPVR